MLDVVGGVVVVTVGVTVGVGFGVVVIEFLYFLYLIFSAIMSFPLGGDASGSQTHGTNAAG